CSAGADDRRIARRESLRASRDPPHAGERHGGRREVRETTPPERTVDVRAAPARPRGPALRVSTPSPIQSLDPARPARGLAWSSLIVCVAAISTAAPLIVAAGAPGPVTALWRMSLAGLALLSFVFLRERESLAAVS